MDLVSGLLRPQKGEIWIDDEPLDRVNLRDWRRKIGYIPQDTILLHDTVMNNITLGDSELNEKDVEDALRAAGAWDFIGTLPDGMTVDAISRATPLDLVKTELGMMHTIGEIESSPLFGDLGGRGWESGAGLRCSVV